MKTIAELYTAADLAWYRENYGDTEYMVHVAGPDDCLTHRDEAATEPLTLTEADDLALAFNRLASEFAPEIHATVFHYGVPVEPVTAEAGAR